MELIPPVFFVVISYGGTFCANIMLVGSSRAGLPIPAFHIISI